ncbi:hypothetical protein ACEE23_00950 [Corynebacterium sp. 32222D000AT]|uniref:hypothetical protein n=1 Tax=Corynebacterium sp. LK2537 TaxID=3110471 RepID=UPI002A93AEE9|nr:hypothetical protein [Mycobacteriaceae bacterium]MDY5828634.1 hypothetical protein [Corynebacterium sp.]
MKLFSRKSLVAGATAIAVSFAGVNVATAEESGAGETSTAATSTPEAPKDDKDQNDNGSSSISDLSSSEGENGEKKDTKKIAEEVKAWVGVASAIIGVLGSLFAFFSKYIDLPGQK